MKLDIEALAREAGGTTVGHDNPQCWSGQVAFNEAELQAFARLIVERCAVECDKRGAQFHAESPFSTECHGLAAAIRQLLEDK